jgi:hypothetical protein
VANLASLEGEHWQLLVSLVSAAQNSEADVTCYKKELVEGGSFLIHDGDQMQSSYDRALIDVLRSLSNGGQAHTSEEKATQVGSSRILSLNNESVVMI